MGMVSLSSEVWCVRVWLEECGLDWPVRVRAVCGGWRVCRGEDAQGCVVQPSGCFTSSSFPSTPK